MVAVADFPKLSFTLRHESPLPLTDFTEAMTRVASRYGRFARRYGQAEDSDLYIAEIRHGSTVVDLVAMGMAAHAAMTAVADGNTLFEFGKNLASLLNAFRHNATPPVGVTLADCDDARAIVQPALHANEGGLNIAVSGDNNIIQPILIDLNRHDAAVIDNRAAFVRRILEQREARVHPNVLLVWHQLRDAPAAGEGKSSPDRAIISELSHRALPVTFADPTAKDEMMRGDRNPFDLGFVVDVKVLVGPGGPTGYLVLALHDVIPLISD